MTISYISSFTGEYTNVMIWIPDSEEIVFAAHSTVVIMKGEVHSIVTSDFTREKLIFIHFIVHQHCITVFGSFLSSICEVSVVMTRKAEYTGVM